MNPAQNDSASVVMGYMYNQEPSDLKLWVGEELDLDRIAAQDQVHDAEVCTVRCLDATGQTGCRNNLNRCLLALIRVVVGSAEHHWY